MPIIASWKRIIAVLFLGQLPKKRRSVLELATGTARAAIPLAQAGHRVVGVDYAQDMLQIATRKRDGVGLTDKQLSLVKADVLTLGLGQKFDWVCVFFNTFLAFTTLKQQDAALTAALRHLKPNGHFWIEIFQPDLRLLANPHLTDLDPSLFFVQRFDRTVQKSIPKIAPPRGLRAAAPARHVSLSLVRAARTGPPRAFH